MNTKGRGKGLQQFEIDYIVANAATSTAADIADHIGRAECTIYALCKKLKLTLKKGVQGRKKGYSPDKTNYKKAHLITPIIKHVRRPEPQEYKRPPAVYNNIPTPYGIADELHHNPKSFLNSY